MMDHAVCDGGSFTVKISSIHPGGGVKTGKNLAYSRISISLEESDISK